MFAAFLLATSFLAAIPAPVVAQELIMVEEAGCPWCARWNAEIGPIYPKTAEGTRAPLRRVDIRHPEAAGVEFANALVFTPTFVLVSDGSEIGRIEGYPGEDFFWGLLGELLKKLPVPDGLEQENPT